MQTLIIHPDDRSTDFLRPIYTKLLEANWADGQADDRAIEIELKDGTKHRFELGLCPESAYNAMIQDAIANVGNDQWWTDQLTLDYWIHERLELF